MLFVLITAAFLSHSYAAEKINYFYPDTFETVIKDSFISAESFSPKGSKPLAVEGVIQDYRMVADPIMKGAHFLPFQVNSTPAQADMHELEQSKTLISSIFQKTRQRMFAKLRSGPDLYLENLSEGGYSSVKLTLDSSSRRRGLSSLLTYGFEPDGGLHLKNLQQMTWVNSDGGDKSNSMHQIIWGKPVETRSIKRLILTIARRDLSGKSASIETRAVLDFNKSASIHAWQPFKAIPSALPWLKTLAINTARIAAAR